MSPQELEILALVADGRTVAAIAIKIKTSERNVKTIMARVRRHLGARNMPHAVAIGYREGILTDGIDREQVALVKLAQEMGYRLALVPRTLDT